MQATGTKVEIHESRRKGNGKIVIHYYSLDDFDRISHRFGIEGEYWSGSLFANNLWDERADLFISNRWKAPRMAVNRPRSIGIQVRYEF